MSAAAGPALQIGAAAETDALPDAEALLARLAALLVPALAAETVLVGVWSGGAWLAERLAAQLHRPAGVISSLLHRDDYAERGMVRDASGPTRLPFAIDHADVLLVDDVLYTGRTLRAVLNELYDYGRPARVRLAVLVDRGGRELPIAADFAAATLALPPGRRLALGREDDGRLAFRWRLRDGDAGAGPDRSC